MYEYKAKIVDVYDGDTFTFVVDLGFSITVKEKLRLYGVDTPELRGSDREFGLVVRDYVKDLILDKDVWIKVHKKGKFGRYVAEVKFISDDLGLVKTDLSKHLLKKGYAKELDYD